MSDEEFEAFSIFTQGEDMVGKEDFENIFKSKFPKSSVDFKTSTTYTTIPRAKFEKVQGHRSVWVKQEDVQYIEQETDDTYFIYLYRREHPLYVKSTEKFIEKFWGMTKDEQA